MDKLKIINLYFNGFDNNFNILRLIYQKSFNDHSKKVDIPLITDFPRADFDIDNYDFLFFDLLKLDFNRLSDLNHALKMLNHSAIQKGFIYCSKGKSQEVILQSLIMQFKCIGYHVLAFDEFKVQKTEGTKSFNPDLLYIHKLFSSDLNYLHNLGTIVKMIKKRIDYCKEPKESLTRSSCSQKIKMERMFINLHPEYLGNIYYFEVLSEN